LKEAKVKAEAKRKAEAEKAQGQTGQGVGNTSRIALSQNDEGLTVRASEEVPRPVEPVTVKILVN
jgi:hypothetical protein